MRPTASFIFLNTQENPHYKIEKDKFSIGRSRKQAEFSISGDPHISRVQAEVEFEDGRFTIRNLGRNPLVVNGRFSREHVLQDGDVIRMGLTEMRFAMGQDALGPETEVLEATVRQGQADEILENEKTKKLNAPFADAAPSAGTEVPAQVPATPRLVRTDASGQVKTFTLDVDNILVGRTLEADIRLNDPAVSRKHCAISKKNDAFYLQNLSKTHPVRINDRETKKSGHAPARLYSGDRILIGEELFTFVSDSPGDTEPIEKRTVAAGAGGTGWLLAAAASLVLIASVGGYFAYQRLYVPYKQNSAVEAVEETFKTGQAEQARNDAVELMKTELSADNRLKLQKVVAESTEYLAMRLETSGNEDQARELIESYLKEHGSAPNAETLRTKLDEMTIRRARVLESNGLLDEALGVFASVSSESLYYETAQSSIDQILERKRSIDTQVGRTVALLEAADHLFSERKYLNPPEDNAYRVYHAVLEIDPENEIALARIRLMKDYYRKEATKHYDKGSCRQAIPFFRDFLTIESDNAEIREKYELCRKRLGLE